MKTTNVASLIGDRHQPVILRGEPEATASLKKQVRELRYERNRFADLHTIAAKRNAALTESLHTALTWLEALRPLIVDEASRREHETRISNIAETLARQSAPTERRAEG